MPLDHALALRPPEVDPWLETLPKFDLPCDDGAAPPRTDGLIKRPVALKLPHGAWKRAGLAERMAREPEILASLTHPSTAHRNFCRKPPDIRLWVSRRGGTA